MTANLLSKLLVRLGINSHFAFRTVLKWGVLSSLCILSLRLQDTTQLLEIKKVVEEQLKEVDKHKLKALAIYK